MLTFLQKPQAVCIIPLLADVMPRRDGLRRQASHKNLEGSLILQDMQASARAGSATTLQRLQQVIQPSQPPAALEQLRQDKDHVGALTVQGMQA